MNGYALLFDTYHHLAFCCICERSHPCQCCDLPADHNEDPCETCRKEHLKELEQGQEEQMSLALKTGLVDSPGE